MIAALLLALGQAVFASPGKPGHIKVGNVTATTAVVHWGASEAGEDARVFYDVQLRRRVEGKPTDWDNVAETVKTEVALGHLKPGSQYEVRVRGWLNKKSSQWRIRENAFKTLGGDHGEGHEGGDGEGHGDGEQDEGHEGHEGGDGEGHDEGEHEGDHEGEGQSDLRLAWVKGKAEAHVAVLWWQLMGDVEGKLAYDVQLRARIEGKAGEWEHAAETTHREVKVDGLKAGTVYDARVRAWRDKKAGPWKIREHVFRTLGGEVEGEDDEEPGEEEGDDGEHSGPVIAWIKAGASDKIAEIGWRLLREFDRTVIFEVQIRERAEEEVGEWRHEAETAKRGIHVDGLRPDTTYDVRVRGWLGDKPGDWKIREAAFRTKPTGGGEGGDHPDEGGEEGHATGKPGEIKVGEVGEHAAVIGWAKPESPADATFFYDVQLRKRINGKPTDWEHAVETAHNEVVLKELSPGTVYEVRVRAWANKKPSAWRAKEEAFKTKGEPPKDGGQAGVPKIAWIKADDIGPRAGVAKWALVHEMDAKVAYDVQIRTRIEGQAGEWKHEAETTKNSIIIDGLKPNTLYEIRVRPWANKQAGEWKVLEHAFRTRKTEGEDGNEEGEGGGDGEGDKGNGGGHDGDGEHSMAPSQPGVIKVSEVTPNSALIQWGASKAPGDTKAVYDVQLRQRLAGTPTEWRYVGETFKTEFAVGELEPGTLYEVRVRAWANKTPGPWQIKEHAFTTGGGEGEQTIDHAGQIDFQVIAGDKMRLIWPAGKGRFVVESSDSIGSAEWLTVDIRPVQVSQMMVADLPIAGAGMRFFRVRN
ncbi:MAG: fibronectin type III domain-containing protein [Verrucomicrobia bacterium]|nr:fibronectin type III domain-containing protein [Verrucomicrobiota bacterium]